MFYNHKLVGITLVRNGNRLGYPYKQCIKSLAGLCDEVVVNVDPDLANYDGTPDDLNKLRTDEKYGHVVWFTSTWNMSNTGDGSELARQANKLLSYTGKNDWVIYLQADEVIHQKDFQEIREFLDKLPMTVSQVELYRTYFWGDLQTRAANFELPLGRIFRRGTHVIGGDGMYLIRSSGSVVRLPVYIYHYSRMGSADKVNTRIRNLDGLFHEPDVVQTFKKFSYDDPSIVKIKYLGTHPEGIEEFYK